MPKTESIELEISDVMLLVEYEYEEGEEMVHNYGDGSGYPGSPAKVEILNISVNGTEITDITSNATKESIEVAIFESKE